MPRLYLDTNILLDVIHNRWQPSIDLIDKVRANRWSCSTSRFAVLEMLDAEQEESFVEKRRSNGLALSQILRRLPARRSKKLGLSMKALDAVYVRLHDSLVQFEDVVVFERPHAKLWDDAEQFCAATNIGAIDSIHLATAIGVQCNILVTRDHDLRRIANEYILSAFPEGIDTALAELKGAVHT